MSAPAAQRRDPLALAAVALAVVAFAGSFAHVRTVVAEHGQPGWLAVATALMPEVSVVLAVLKVRRARTTGEPVAWAWVVGTSAAAFTIAANLATAEPSPWGWVVAGWPAWSAICAAGLIELRPERTPATSTRNARTTLPPTRRKATDAPATPAPTPSPTSVPALDQDVTEAARQVAADLAEQGAALTRRSLITGLRERGVPVGTTRAAQLLADLRTAA